MASLVPAWLPKAVRTLGMPAETEKCAWPLQLSLYCPACLVCSTQCKLLRVEVTCWCVALSTAGPNPISVSGHSMMLTMKEKRVELLSIWQVLSSFCNACLLFANDSQSLDAGYSRHASGMVENTY